MATRRKSAADQPRRRRPASTPEGRENQLVARAVDLAEKQLEEGTASAAVITHYLKLGSIRGRLEEQRLANENELLRAKVDQLASAKKVEDLYEKALNAMRQYAGQEPIESEYDDED